MAFWRLLCSNARPSKEGLPAEVTDAAEREEVRWALGRRLDEIDRRRKDHWLFAYTTAAASFSVDAAVLARPAWMTPVVGWAAAVAAIVLWLLWAAGHAATTAALLNARAGKEAAYAMLGRPIRDTRVTEAPLFDVVPAVLAVLTSAAAASAFVASVLLGAGGI